MFRQPFFILRRGEISPGRITHNQPAEVKSFRKFRFLPDKIAKEQMRVQKTGVTDVVQEQINPGQADRYIINVCTIQAGHINPPPH